MTHKHLTDEEIQQYILQKVDCHVDVTEHIQHCTNCKIKAEQYKLLFEAIKQQEKPVFDFKLNDLVIEQLPKLHKGSYEKSFSYFFTFLIIFFVCIGLYLFGGNLLNLFRGITPVLIGLIITTVTSLLVFLCIDMYRKYQTQMNALNFY